MKASDAFAISLAHNNELLKDAIVKVFEAVEKATLEGLFSVCVTTNGFLDGAQTEALIAHLKRMGYSSTMTLEEGRWKVSTVLYVEWIHFGYPVDGIR